MATVTVTETMPLNTEIQPPASAKQQDSENYFDTLKSRNVEPLWNVLHKMVPPKPHPKASAERWLYDELRPMLMQAGDIVSAEEAQRRVLMLVNRALEAPFTTDTIYAGLQLVLPGETAPAHRHTAFALRFIIEGSDGFTAVEGQKIPMARGDVILTPSWSWHDHGNEGSGPMIWLDGLDLPVYTFLRNNFAEDYCEARYPSTPAESSDLRFPWRDVAIELDNSDAAFSMYQYRHKDGSHLSKTISIQAERVKAGTKSPPSQETCSFVYHVFEGTGSTVVKTEESSVNIPWTKGDTFAVPSWSVVSHTCEGTTGHAYLVAINDRPMVEALGMARKG